MDGKVRAVTISAHLGILYECADTDFLDFFQFGESKGEALYLLLYQQVFGLPDNLSDTAIRDQAIEYLGQKTQTSEISFLLDQLKDATDSYIERNIATQLRTDEINVVGLSVNFNQFYASLYCIEYLKKHYPLKYVFVMGGATTSLPKALDIISRLKQEIFIIQGEGEKRFIALLNSLIMSSNLDFKKQIRIEGIHNVSKPSNTLFNPQAHEGFQIQDLTKLPFPDYDEYFDLLKSFCDSPMTARQLKQNVTLLIEGSRGCVFGCDFCGFNSVWKGYRSKTTSRIMEEVEYMSRRYGTARIYFVDNLCDPWVKQFANEMVRAHRGIQSFMEMRASHKETFWTSLKLSGVERIQVGVEAIAPDLLKKMNKKTSAIENIRAVKYLSELGIKSSANLITYHPSSTMKDISITKELLLKIKHLQPFTLSGFAVCVGSPIFKALTAEEKNEIIKETENRYIASSLKSFSLDWRLPLPKAKRLSKELVLGWDEFTDWYDKLKQSVTEDLPVLIQKNIGSNALLLLDTRNGCDEHLLLDTDYQIYEACHHAPTPNRVEEITGVPYTEVMERLERLIERGLILNIKNRFLSLAVRDANMLINRFYDATNDS